MSCATCHSGSVTGVLGKPTSGILGGIHTAATGDCASCHVNTAFKPAKFSGTPAHTGFTGASCAFCHFDGTAAKNTNAPMPASHPKVSGSSDCSSCHTKTAWKPATAGAMPADVVHNNSTTTNCATCHSNGYDRSASLRTFQHSLVKAGVSCATCHSGSVTGVLGKPTSGILGGIHTAATGDCASCHVVGASFVPARFAAGSIPAGHAGFAAGSCATCHVNGTAAKNTNAPLSTGHTAVSASTDCSSCHTKTAWKPATAGAMPADVVHNNSTTTNCATCHSNGYDRSASLRTFQHSLVKAGVSCATCHSGSVTGVLGKPTSGILGGIHTAATGDCASCHVVGTTFVPARFAAGSIPAGHAGFAAGSCATCHVNGTAAKNTNAPLSTGHPAVSASTDCSSCHTKTAWKPATAGAMPADVVHNNSTTTNCATCHSNGYDRSASLRTFQHSLVKAGVSCATCHSGSVTGVLGKPTSGILGGIHTAATGDCASCHVVGATFVPARFAAGSIPAGHAGFAAGSCATCHVNGTAAKNTNAPLFTGHPAVSASTDCSSCHTKTAWKPATAGAMPADVVHNNSTTTNCATCHSNGYDRSASLRTFQHSLVKAGVSCATCHSGSVTGVLGKPTSGILGGIHTAATGDCASCHVVGATFVPARFAAGSIPAGHAGFAAGSCATCHVNGTAAKNTNAPLSTGHPAVSASTDCSSCHTKTAWKPATAGAMPADVVHNNSTTTNCATCHSNGYDRSASLRTFQHSLVKAGVSCATCHSGSVTGVLGKPTSGILGGIHTAATGDCASCHVVGTTFVPARFAAGSIPAGHAGFAAGSCATCHVNGTAAKNTNAPLSTGHPAVSASTDCSSCHTKTAWKPATAGAMPADVVHNNSTTTNCATCHSNGYDRSASLRTFQHSLVKAGVSCATCHSGSVTGVLGKPTSGILGGIHTAATGDCASCHVVGTTFVPARFAAGSIPAGHAGFAAGSCATCHVNGTAAKNTNAPLSTGHPAVSASTDCSSCHTKTAWKPATAGAMPADVVHNNSTTTNCATCHSNGYDRSASLRTFQHSLVKAGVSCATCHSGSVTGVLGKPTSGILGGIHTAATGDCASCHVVGTTFVPARFAAGSIPAGHAGFAAGSCATCHVNGTAAKNTNAPLSTGHPAVSASTDCSSCHTKTAWKPATAGAMPADVVHNNSTTTNCATCHSNGYDRSASLRTFQHSLVKAGVSCATCHSGSVTGVLGKPTSGILGGIHTAATGDCASCHVVGTTFVPARFAAGSIPAGHAGFAAGSCATCHVNGTAAKNTNAPLSTGHPAVSASTDCSSCHTKTAWKPATAGAMPADVVHNNSTTTNCATCHSNGYDRSASLRTFQHSLVKAGVSCATCHSGSVTGVLGKPTSGILGGIHTAATGDCASCHVVGAASCRPALPPAASRPVTPALPPAAAPPATSMARRPRTPTPRCPPVTRRSAPAPTAVAATPRRRGSRPPPGRCRPTWCITTAPPPTAPPATATATTAAPRCAPSSTAWSRPG